MRGLALSRWDNEGGAALGGSQEGSPSNGSPSSVPELTNTDLVQLRVRVIALENVMISLLAQSSERQLDLVREMSTYISPRPGFTHHPLTIHAASGMLQLVERAQQFRQLDDSKSSPGPVESHFPADQ